MGHPRIRVLRHGLVEQIAAVEEVESPASVAKELVETDPDAGAGRITIEVEGVALVRVADDGHGMDGGMRPWSWSAMRRARSRRPRTWPRSGTSWAARGSHGPRVT